MEHFSQTRTFHYEMFLQYVASGACVSRNFLSMALTWGGASCSVVVTSASRCGLDTDDAVEKKHVTSEEEALSKKQHYSN